MENILSNCPQRVELRLSGKVKELKDKFNLKHLRPSQVMNSAVKFIRFCIIFGIVRCPLLLQKFKTSRPKIKNFLLSARLVLFCPLTLCGKPLMTTLLRASSDMSHELSFHTWAAMLYSSISGSCNIKHHNVM